MLTADEPWNPERINDSTEGQVVYPDEDDVMKDDMTAYIH